LVFFGSFVFFGLVMACDGTELGTDEGTELGPFVGLELAWLDGPVGQCETGLLRHAVTLVTKIRNKSLKPKTNFRNKIIH
jgi:hypothetical protein